MLKILVLAVMMMFRSDYGVVMNDCTIVTDDGCFWEYETDLPEWTVVKVTFNTLGTVEIYDDAIVGLEVMR